MLAAFSTRQVKIERVVDLLQVSHAPDLIQAYADAMRAGDSFPPVSVIPFGRRYIITDGHKRFNACRALGLEEIEVEIWTLGRLFGDLGRQSVRHLRTMGTAARNLTRGPEGRRDAYNFAATTAAHWRRTVVSLWNLARRKVDE
jgi:ParB/Sulfiredoxin domain